LLLLLDNEELRRIAVLKMEGYTNQDIAEHLGCAPVTVERRLKLIRKSWLAQASLPPRDES
jgi:DNA-directed RNA polymerase specialized sigma24 family protein